MEAWRAALELGGRTQKNSQKDKGRLPLDYRVLVVCLCMLVCALKSLLPFWDSENQHRTLSQARSSTGNPLPAASQQG